MNVRNKVISIVMSFIICFGFVSNSFANDKKQLNYNIEPLVFDGGVISAPMLATVSALAVGTGIIIKNTDDIYDLGHMFYDYVKNNNELTWDFVQSAFLAGHTLINNYVHVDSNFLDIVKGFFDSEIKGKEEIGNISTAFGIPYFEGNISDFSKYYTHFLPISATNSDTNFGDFTLKCVGGFDVARNVYDVYYNDIKVASNLNIYFDGNKYNWVPRVYIQPSSYNSNSYYVGFVYNTPNSGFVSGEAFLISKTYANAVSFPYTGGYTWDNVENKKENDTVALPIPGNLGNLVGQGSDNFWDNTDGLVGGGSITLPGVNNPSIGVTDDVFVGSPSTDIPGTDAPGVDNPGIDKPGIVFPPFGGGLDFSPITQSSFTDKFPFSLGKDIKNIISVFDVEPKAPKFTVPIVSEELEIDLTQFNVWAGIIRFFVLIGFMIALINITRKVIG